MGSQTEISAFGAGSRPSFEDINAWFRSDLGQHILRTETLMLEQLLPGLFGYHLAQVSVQKEPLHQASPIQNKFSIGLDGTTFDSSEFGSSAADSLISEEPKTHGVISSPADLPFADDSIDVVLAHHLLEFANNPQDILRELSRVTLPMGHVIFVGFNPHSLWGLWRSFAQFKGNAPWNGDFIRPGRLMDWLNLLNFRIDRAQYAIYRPPLQRYPGKLGDYSKGVSRSLNVPIGSLYVIVARKHIGSVRRIKPVWKTEQSFGQLSAVRSMKPDGLSSTSHEPPLD